MFGRKKQLELLSVFAGEITTIEQVPDPVFSQKMLGDGYAVTPNDDVSTFTVVAPCDGTVSQLFQTAHAFALTTEQGVDLLIHIGLDTVELKGQGLTPLVHQGDHVQAGQSIIEVDADSIRNAGKSLVTPVVFTNMKQIASVNITEGSAPAKQAVCTATLS